MLRSNSPVNNQGNAQFGPVAMAKLKALNDRQQLAAVRAAQDGHSPSQDYKSVLWDVKMNEDAAKYLEQYTKDKVEIKF